MSTVKHKAVREGYHFAIGGKLARDGTKILAGKTYIAKQSKRAAKKVYLCGPGLHASPLAHQAFRYLPGDTLSKVIVRGIPSLDGYDGSKFCGKTRTHVKVVRLDAEQKKVFHYLHSHGLYTVFDGFAKNLVG